MARNIKYLYVSFVTICIHFSFFLTYISFYLINISFYNNPFHFKNPISLSFIYMFINVLEDEKNLREELKQIKLNSIVGSVTAPLYKLRCVLQRGSAQLRHLSEKTKAQVATMILEQQHAGVK